MMMKTRGAAALVAALVLSGPPARADQPRSSAPAVSAQAQSELPGSRSAERPWVVGVPAAEQKAALDLFREGNALLKESLFVQAAAKYREALGHWNHPGIHYNLALALLNLDQPVEVYRQLEAALSYGPAPLDADKYEHANRYRALIEKQLAHIEVRCSQPAAVVTMDGLRLFVAPGHYEGLVRVGQHTVVAERRGFVTVQKTPTLPAGETTKIDLRMFTAEQLTRYKRRWPLYMPVAVLAAGVVVAGVGGILQWQASESFKAYDRSITTCSLGSATGGCTPNGALAGKRSAGEAMQGTALAFYGVGAALIAAGGVLAYMNRARPYHVDEGEAPPLVVAPVVSSSAAGVSVTVRF
jgi:tetratricopeptide (TPR) repeat protein